MTKQERIDFIAELCGNVTKELLDKVDKMPEEWDGIELRWLIAEKFSQVVFSQINVTRKRKHEYNNTVLVENL